VGALRIAWTAPLRANGAFAGGDSSSPIIVRGVVYIQDTNSDVEALALGTGKVLWKRVFNDPTGGPNGLAYAKGSIYGATETRVFSLNASSGAVVWKSRRLPRNGNESIDTAPGVSGGRVYVSTVPGAYKTGFYSGNAAGVIWALNAKTGRTEWKFNTVPLSLWGHRSVNTGGGSWNAPAFDARGGVFVGVGNPGPTNAGGVSNAWDKSRPGLDLYTDSVLRLNQATGKLGWYYQVIPHDLYDWDSQLTIYDPAKDTVYAAGKYGQVLAFRAQTGKLLWRTYVGIHNGHDHDDLLALHRKYSKLPNFPFTIEPGEAGGIETPMALSGTTLYAPVVNVPYRITSPGTSSADFTTGTGELVAIDTMTGATRWDEKLPSPLFGGATVVNDVVFAADYAGTIYALNRFTGTVLWRSQMPADTNAQIAISGNTLVTAASAPQPGQQPAIIAYRLGG
jgi:outer membrane protein assembly factor BamB